MVNDYHAQLDKHYQQLLELLVEMAALASDAAADEEDEELSPLGERESIEALVEVAEENGLDPETVEPILKAVAHFVKVSKA